MRRRSIIPIIKTSTDREKNGVRPTTPNPTSGEWSFGEKFAPGMTQILFNNLTVPYEPQGSRIKNFTGTAKTFRTPWHSKQYEKGGLHLSLNNTQNNGIMPNNKFNRKSMNLGFSYNLSEQFRCRAISTIHGRSIKTRQILPTRIIPFPQR